MRLRPDWPTTGKLLALFVVYFASARLGLLFDPVSHVATPIWPPTGLALAALWIFGRRLWPAAALAAFAVNWSVGVPLLTALTMAAGNTFEALVAFELLSRARLHPALDRLRDVFALVLYAACVSTAVSASFGTAGLWLGGVPADLPLVFRTWWIGDLMGDLLLAPLLLVWAVRAQPASGGRLEAVLLGVTQCAMMMALSFFHHTVLKSYLIFPGLIWAAIRFGQRGAVTALFGTSLVAVWGTATGHGLFTGGTRAENLLALQTFFAVAAVTTMVLGAAVEERARAVAHRDEILEIVSHDLRNPLSSILMNARYLLKRAPAEAARERQQLDIIVQAAQRIDHLVGDLRHVAQIESGQLSLVVGPQLVGELVAGAVKVLGPLAAVKQQQITVDVPPALQASCDAERIGRVLQNLIGNAIKFTPADGSIDVRARELGGEVCVDIDDTGPGIAREQRPHVFDRYWKGDDTARQGMGLGLFIAKEIVAAHGGRIWIEDKPTVGTRFRFTLPRMARAAAGAAAVPAVPAGASGPSGPSGR